MSDKKWYVLKSISGKEIKVKDYIEKEFKYLGLERHLGEIVIPMEKTIQIRDGKKIQKEKPLYKGYIFIEVELVGEVPHNIRNISGVIGFLSEVKGGDPVPMRKAEINRMLGKIDELSEQEELVHIPYLVGETVKVSDGAFNGFNGTIESINEEKRKLEVMVLIFGRKTPLELSFMQVEKV